MKLLFDQNISYRIVGKLNGVFPHLTHVSQVRLANADDIDIWRKAKEDGYTIVTFDSDYFDMSLINGIPPKIIWLRTGNLTTTKIAELLTLHQKEIAVFLSKDEYRDVACLEIY